MRNARQPTGLITGNRHRLAWCARGEIWVDQPVGWPENGILYKNGAMFFFWREAGGVGKGTWKGRVQNVGALDHEYV